MVHMHVCETRGQFLQGKKLFGCSPVAHLDHIGVLNDRLSMAHCVWLTDDDIDRVAARGTIVIHNPASNGKLGSGRMRFDEMLRRNVRLGSGDRRLRQQRHAEYVRSDATGGRSAQSQ